MRPNVSTSRSLKLSSSRAKPRIAFVPLAIVLLSLSSSAGIFQKEGAMPIHATGSFDVKIVPQPQSDHESRASISRFSISKQLHGDLEATSEGEMLTSGDPKSGSAAYVAIERVTGTLRGLSGSFVLQHTASMTPTSQQMLITVAPDSGTGQLVGLSGKFLIKIENKQHFYDFEYDLPPAH